MSRLVLAIAMALGFALATPPGTAVADPPAYYPPMDWIPAARSNYDVGRTSRIVAIVIHATDGPWTSAVTWFRNPRSRVSAHYLVRAWGGGIMQFVAESDTAYHARSANPWSIGIEHEFDPRHGIWFTDAQYRSSARLVCAIATRYGIPLDRNHIVGHNELADNDHRDPGPYWNWTYYMSLVRAACTRAPSTPVKLSLAPASDLQFGDYGAQVAHLQWSLAFLGFMSVDDITGSGNFGPLTQDGVAKFQEASGLPITGIYGEQTAAKLAESLAGDLGSEPAVLVEPGIESDDVTRIQSQLQELGYMDLVTGYYGPVTQDAVARFQGDNGIEASGVYAAVTRVALVYRGREVRNAALAAQAAADAEAQAELLDTIMSVGLVLP